MNLTVRKPIRYQHAYGYGITGRILKRVDRGRRGRCVVLRSQLALKLPSSARNKPMPPACLHGVKFS